MVFLIKWSKALRDLFFRRDDFIPLLEKYHISKRHKIKFTRYNARSNGFEDIRNVFKYKNDGGEITKTEENEMKEYFNKILRQKNWQDLEIDDKVLKMCGWLNNKFRYTSDKSYYGKYEFWSSPWDLYVQLRDKGYIKGDCDDYSVLFCCVAKYLGVPACRRFVRAGDVYDKNGNYAGGHATFIYYNERYNEMFPIEGSYYPKYINSLYEKIPLKDNKIYGRTWFFTNEEKTYLGNKYWGGI